MYLLFVDESGDVGMKNSPTAYFCLSGLVVHESKWRPTLDKILEFRRQLSKDYGLKLKDEIHAAPMIHSPGALSRIPKSIRLRILKLLLEFETTLDISIINVVVQKEGKPDDFDVFESAWQALIQRFENTLEHGNFPGPPVANDRGMLVVDRTEEQRLRSLTRKMRHFNMVPSHLGTTARPMPLKRIIEDPVFRDSHHSYFIQLCDVNAYFLMQKRNPNNYIKRKGAKNYFNKLEKVLCKHASRKSPMGVVWL